MAVLRTRRRLVLTHPRDPDVEEFIAGLVDPAEGIAALTAGADDDDDAVRRRQYRLSLLAATTDHSFMKGRTPVAPPVDVTRQLTFDEFRSFARQTWATLDRREPLYVSQIEQLPQLHQLRYLQDADAMATWKVPPPWVRLSGELAGVTGPIAYLDVRGDGRFQLVALHEIAHLLVDGVDRAEGHTLGWVAAHLALQQRFIGPTNASMWWMSWRLDLDRLVRRLRASPDMWRPPA